MQVFPGDPPIFDVVACGFEVRIYGWFAVMTWTTGVEALPQLVIIR